MSAINSNATNQPKCYQVNLLVDDDGVDEALADAVLAAAHADDVTIQTWQDLKSRGLLVQYRNAVVKTAVEAYLD
jgi:hypothetical protein